MSWLHCRQATAHPFVVNEVCCWQLTVHRQCMRWSRWAVILASRPVTQISLV